MLKLKATKTDRYAQRDPSKPQHLLIKDREYDLPDELAKRVVELKGGKLVKVPVEKSEEDSEEKVAPTEQPAPKVETKESKTPQAQSTKRTPGQPKK